MTSDKTRHHHTPEGNGRSVVERLIRRSRILSCERSSIFRSEPRRSHCHRAQIIATRQRDAPACPPKVALALCGGAGLAAGGILGRGLEHEGMTRWRRWGAAAVVGGLMATMGCLALGVGSAVGAAVGIAVGAAMAAGMPRRVTA